MKTKVVQHVPRIAHVNHINHVNLWNHVTLTGSQLLYDFQTFCNTSSNNKNRNLPANVLPLHYIQYLEYRDEES